MLINEFMVISEMLHIFGPKIAKIRNIVWNEALTNNWLLYISMKVDTFFSLLNLEFLILRYFILLTKSRYCDKIWISVVAAIEPAVRWAVFPTFWHNSFICLKSLVVVPHIVAVLTTTTTRPLKSDKDTTESSNLVAEKVCRLMLPSLY